MWNLYIFNNYTFKSVFEHYPINIYYIEITFYINFLNINYSTLKSILTKINFVKLILLKLKFANAKPNIYLNFVWMWKENKKKINKTKKKWRDEKSAKHVRPKPKFRLPRPRQVIVSHSKYLLPSQKLWERNQSLH